MVKNKTGGKNAKRTARKNVNQENTVGKRLRIIENDDESYAITTKMLGNGQMEVLCMDNKPRLCFIRYKFSGRNKSSNMISIGSWIIVGLRSWETKVPGKLEKCDLLEIYTNSEKNNLVQEYAQNISALLKHENMSNDVGDEDVVDFIEGGNGGDDDAMKAVKNGGGGGVAAAYGGGGGDVAADEDEIDFDEI